MPPKRATKGYKMPEPLPLGEVLQDVHKKQFVLGPSIGKGGFGEIYSAQESGGKKGQYPYVVKIEPHANGPLFVEMHFYSRNAKAADIEAFKSSKKMKNLGMPAYIASGTHEHNGEKFRFIVMDKFDSDLRKRYEENGNKLPAVTVFRIGLQMIDVLEYIHSRGYVHADIKEANILLSKSNPNQAYLVDFGLTGRFSTETEFKPNPKRMHDGTIEFVSRDGHQGVLTRRGDLEILAYNLIHWLGCKLPWEKNLSNPKPVQESKEKFMSDIPLFMKTCFGNEVPDSIVKFLKFILDTKFNAEPDYEKARKILSEGVKYTGGTNSGPLTFKTLNKRKSEAETATPEKKAKITKKPAQKRVNKKKQTPEEVETNETNGHASSEEDENVENKKVTKQPAKRRGRVPTVSTIDDNGVIHNSEMMRIQALLVEKKNKPAPRRRPNTRLNKSLDIISDSETEEVLPVSRRRAVKV